MKEEETLIKNSDAPKSGNCLPQRRVIKNLKRLLLLVIPLFIFSIFPARAENNTNDATCWNIEKNYADHNFEDANFANANFRYANFEGADFEGAIFKQVNLSSTIWAKGMKVLAIKHGEEDIFLINERSLAMLEEQGLPVNILANLNKLRGSTVVGYQRFQSLIKQVIGDENAEKYSAEIGALAYRENVSDRLKRVK